MKIEKTAIAGTLESSDVQITLSSNPSNDVLIDLDSQVIEQFGTQIKKVITELFEEYNITSVHAKVVDKGALDCVIKARLKTAIHRSLSIENQDTPWEVL